MKITIITVTYNSASTIEDTVKSVVGQDYPEVEYIIIDGKSTDTTLKIVEQYEEQVSKVISEKDEGMYHALNKGIDMATGDLIGILNSDDIYTSSEVLSKVVNKMNKEGSDVLYADLEYVHPENLKKVIRHWHSGEYEQGKFKKGWMPPHPTFFVKKEIYERYGKFNTEFKSAADYELMLRLLHKYKVKPAYLPEVIVKMRTGGKSNVTLINRLKANMEDRRAWKVNGLKPGPFTLLFKPLSKLGQFMGSGRGRQRSH